MKVAVLQSNYLPWKGYFDIIHMVDKFVFYDEVQYTKNDWRNRNKILTQDGLKWITVPVNATLKDRICDVPISVSQPNWQKKHFHMLMYEYGGSPYLKRYKDFLEYVYLERRWEYLFELNRYLITHIATEFLGIHAEFLDSRDLLSEGTRGDKLISLLKSVGALEYLSGPAAKSYIVEEDFIKNGIQLKWMEYSGYPEYRQLYQPFSHNVSIVDLLFNVGPDAPYYIWGWRT